MEFQLNRHYLVLAPNYRWFLEWCRENGLDREQLNVKYVNMPTQLLGFKGPDVTVVKLTGWWTTNSLNYLEQMRGYIKRLEFLGAEVVDESV